MERNDPDRLTMLLRRITVSVAVAVLLVGSLTALFMLRRALLSSPSVMLRLPSAIQASYSPDGKHIAMTSYGSGRDWLPYTTVWDSQTGDNIVELPRRGMEKAVYSPDGASLVTLPLDSKILVWDTVRWELAGEYPTGGLYCDMDYSSDGRYFALATCGPSGGHVYLSEVGSEGEFGEFAPLADTVTHVAFSSDSQLIAASSGIDDAQLQIWDVTNGDLIRSFEQPGDILTLAWVPGEHIIATGGLDDQVYIWDVDEGELITTLNQSEDTATRVKWDSEAHLTPGFYDLYYAGAIRAVEFSPDGRFLLAGGEIPVTVWDTASWEVVSEFGKGDVTGIDFSPDGHSVVVTHRNEPNDDRNTIVWNLSRLIDWWLAADDALESTTSNID